jgi:cell division initiation protein
MSTINAMDLSSQVLHDVEFREAKRGGYNTQDVDEFLERLAVSVERQEAFVREARQRVQSAEARAAEAERQLRDAELNGGGSVEADETLKRTLVLAQRTADAAIREAEERAARTIAAAEDQVSQMLTEARESTANAYAEAEAEARQSQAEARARVLAELNELEALRHQLRTDVELLERHVEHQRERLRVTIHDLQRLLDNPGALREIAVPALDDIEIPEPDPIRPIVAPVVPAPPRRLVADPVPTAVVDQDEWEDEEPPQWAAESVFEPDTSEYEPVPPPPSRRTEGQRARGVDGVLRAGHEDDDAYLAELRKAMTDERPLGPREGYDDEDAGDEPGGGRSRFGRRR